MASGGSSVQSAAGSRSFDFGSDDLLCSFEDNTFLLDPTADGKRLDSSAKDLHKNRVRSPLANVYGQPEEFSREDLIYAVEKCMKKFSDNLTKHLEGISGRLTQLELYYYKLERSIGEFHTDMIRDQSEADLKLSSLKKHVHEVHRSIQIIRDKQELSETQKELSKLELSQKDSINLIHSQKHNEDFNSATSENKAKYESNDVPNQQLSLPFPYQISSPPPSIAITAPDKNHPEKELPVPLTVFPRDHYALNQANSYYYTHHQQLLLEQQSQNLQPELHNAQLMVKMHDLSLQTPPAYAATYAPNQHANKTPESHQFSSILLPSPYSAPQSDIYGDSSNTVSLLQPQLNMQQQPLPHASQGYVRTSTYPSHSNMLGYNAVYVIDGNRASHLQSCHIGSYPPNGDVAASLISSNHPYGDMTENVVSMGHPRD